jgi:DNA-directed RNA polymerase specialized sigma24 family protein
VQDEQDDDGPLWTRARSNDGTAFAELFDRHRPRVYRRALSLLGDVHDAEDVTAAAFYELWRKRRTVPLVAGSVLPWLLVTAVNLGLGRRRRHRRRGGRVRAAAAPRRRSVRRTRTGAGFPGNRLTAVQLGNG